MTFSISEKNLALYSTIVILVAALATSFLVYKVQAQEEKNNYKVQIDKDLVLGVEDNDLAGMNQGVPSGSTIEHLPCSTELVFGDLPVSETYNPNTSYNLSAFSNGIHLQDVNGDNLPDYSYITHSIVGIGNSLNTIYRGCVLLNNGNGWTKAHVCQAITNQDLVTGEFTSREYRGDCAGEPSVKAGGNTNSDDKE